MSTRTSQLFEIADPDAPVGSASWCRAALDRMRELKRQSQNAVSSLKYRLLSFAKDQHFTQLVDRNGAFFLTWEDFVQYPEPFGLGMRADVAAAIMHEPDDRRLLGDVYDDVKPARDEKGGRPRKDQKVNNIHLPKGTSALRLVARLKRDHPEIAARLNDFSSVRAAARAAGIKVDTPQLVLLRRAWNRATAEERATFRAEICDA